MHHGIIRNTVKQGLPQLPFAQQLHSQLCNLILAFNKRMLRVALEPRFMFPFRSSLPSWVMARLRADYCYRLLQSMGEEEMRKFMRSLEQGPLLPEQSVEKMAAAPASSSAASAVEPPLDLIGESLATEDYGGSALPAEPAAAPAMAASPARADTQQVPAGGNVANWVKRWQKEPGVKEPAAPGCTAAAAAAASKGRPVRKLPPSPPASSRTRLLTHLRRILTWVLSLLTTALALVFFQRTEQFSDILRFLKYSFQQLHGLRSASATMFAPDYTQMREMHSTRLTTLCHWATSRAARSGYTRHCTREQPSQQPQQAPSRPHTRKMSLD